MPELGFSDGLGGGVVLSPFGSPPRQRREYAKENSKLFQKVL